MSIVPIPGSNEWAVYDGALQISIFDSEEEAQEYIDSGEAQSRKDRMVSQ